MTEFSHIRLAIGRKQMQFYTVIGAIVIAWCGVESARRLNRGVQDDIRVIDAYLSLLRYIRTQIDCYALPIGEIFEKIFLLFA